MRIVFIGGVAFSRSLLEATVHAGGNVVAVFGLSPALAARHGDYADLEPVARSLNVPFVSFANINDAPTILEIRKAAPDVIFVFGLSQLLGEELLGIAPCIGSHPALLPRDRGRHPITWALVDGLSLSGLTFLWLDEGADTGDILWQQSFPIGPDDTASDLLARIEELGGVAVREFVPQLAAGVAPRRPQDDRYATVRRKRSDEDRRIDWHGTTMTVHNLVRGLARPYVGALARRDGQDIRVWKTRSPALALTADRESMPPGTVFATAEGIAVRTGDGYVIIEESDADLLDGDVLDRMP